MFRSSVLSLDTGRETYECPAQSCPHYSSEFHTSAAGVLLLVLAFSRWTIVPFHIKIGLNHRVVLPLVHLCFSAVWKLPSHDAPLLIHGVVRPQTEPPSQRHIQIQKELWRIQDVMEALAKNKPQRSSDSSEDL